MDFNLTRAGVSRATIEETLAVCDYPFSREDLPTIPVIETDSVRLRQALAAWAGPNEGILVKPGRNLPASFLHEVFHALDTLRLTDEQRRVLHLGMDEGRCGLGWWEPREDSGYLKRPHEAAADIFVMAYSPIPRAGFPAHPATASSARFMRAYLTPELPPAPWLKDQSYKVTAKWDNLSDVIGRVDLPLELAKKVNAHKKQGHKVML